MKKVLKDEKMLFILWGMSIGILFGVIGIFPDFYAFNLHVNFIPYIFYMYISGIISSLISSGNHFLIIWVLASISSILINIVYYSLLFALIRKFSKKKQILLLLIVFYIIFLILGFRFLVPYVFSINPFRY